MYAALSAPLPDAGAYLARIGLDPDDYRKSLRPELPASPSEYSAPHTKQALDRLVNAHLHTVPFENLDVYELRQVPSLATADLFEKIVLRRRGGYCFELNALFFALLQALGYDCHPLAQRVVRLGPAPLNHRSTLVTLPDGTRLLCDVGYGGPTPVTALDLDKTGLQTSGARTFRIFRDDRGAYHLQLVRPEGEQPILHFTDAPFDPMDFVPANFFAARHEGGRFRSLRVLSLIRPDGRVTMEGDTLRIRKNGTLTEATLSTAADRVAAYTGHFGMPPESVAVFAAERQA